MRLSVTKKVAVVLPLILLMIIILAGCSSTLKDKRTDPVSGERKGAGKYYHFDDILIPSELKYDYKRSFIYETPRFKTGTMVFKKFWVEVDSLIDFFTYNMEKDNWKLLNSFRGKESILNFSKPEKTCGIRIVETWYGTTFIEVRVGPLAEKKT